MSEARLQILRLLADRRITAAEADVLLAAWAEGYPEEATSPDPGVAPSREVEDPRVRSDSSHEPEPDSFPAYDRPPPVRTGRRRSGSLESSPAPPPDADEEIEVEPPGLDEPERPQDATPPSPSPAPTGEEFDLRAGESIEVENQTIVRIVAQPAETELRDDPLTSIVVRGVETNRVMLIRGEGGRVRRSGAKVTITWRSGLLLLEVPTRLGSLEFESIPGSLGLSGYSGPFTVDGLAGPLTVHGPRSPFRIRNVRGLVRVLRLALRDGISTIAQSDGDVEIEADEEASVSIRAVSTEGGVNIGESGEDAGSANLRRRGVWRLGAGTAQLNVSTIRGKISLRRMPGPAGGSRS